MDSADPLHADARKAASASRPEGPGPAKRRAEPVGNRAPEGSGQHPEDAAGSACDQREDAPGTETDLDPALEAGPDFCSGNEPFSAKEPDPDAQPLDADGVHENMASATYGRDWAAVLPPGAGTLGVPQAADDSSDAAIMLRVREGDDSGFTYLIEKYRKQIIYYMFRMCGNQAVAEELAQEVFLRVYRSRESYRAEAKFTTWLYRIATNLGVNYARDHKHEKAAQNVYLDQPDADTGTTPDVADSRLTAEQNLLRSERMLGIRQKVMSLPERQREAVLMHKYQEMDYREIGAVLKLSESATKSLLFRAYQTLREQLKEYV
ncbi:RNA polymerase sigma factor [Acidipila sp. EB88]|uniref:RNA polymerase sigma factor n=1 Tax=Acidipila sp. EB88 TaxID=2305226 RepID=UPI001F481B21|nr:RNA polymerase sigma factor [Acidipila sp. EB88]